MSMWTEMRIHRDDAGRAFEALAHAPQITDAAFVDFDPPRATDAPEVAFYAAIGLYDDELGAVRELERNGISVYAHRVRALERP